MALVRAKILKTRVLCDDCRTVTTMMKLQGAVVGYLIVMSILLILLVREYVTQRLKFSKGGRR